MRALIGIYAHEAPAGLRATLAAVRIAACDVVVIADTPDPATAAAIRALAGVHVLWIEGSGGGPPACFNRLAAAADAEAVILLESGALPAPGALERLLAALGQDGVGIAGPSTNSAWNEQAAFPGHRGSPADVARTGAEAVRRFGTATRSLGPLWGPADFCLAVSRDVIATIGAADEGYGLGPCWEMEYCARAMRAGFDAVWVGGAYVWRAPFTRRRTRGEQTLFEASRRRYQDGLCALRLRGERAGYEPHCRGDVCEHFAPPELITLTRALAPPAPAAVPAVPSPARPREPDRLVTCIMPTRDRADFALHAVELFRHQDYERRELVIVDDGSDDLAARLPDDPRIRYVRAPRGETIGAKRNRAIAGSRGAFLVQWDDDDWYGPRRLSAQLAPLLAGRADITGLTCPLFFELDPWRFWRVSPRLHSRLFIGDVHGGTLALTRRVWDQLAQYPAASLAEDAALLRRATARGARLERVRGEGHFVYLRHGANAWRFVCGEHVDRNGWTRGTEPPFAPGDRAFYAARSTRVPAGQPPAGPLVSCLMPTADRRHLVPRAIAYFERQDYPHRELVVLDDGTDRVADLIPSDPRIRYVGLDRRLVLGEKRNRVCEVAAGDILVHWDDDDWHAPHRLSYQVAQLEQHGASICGTSRVLYFDPARRLAWMYRYPPHARPWVLGLAYRRAAWERQRFAAVQVGEDTRFVFGAGQPLVLDDHRFMAGVMHRANTSPKRTNGPCWSPRPLDEIKELLGPDWALYEAAA
jgi:glycosyltransferase involved in cell wall biosynthesis